MSDLSRLLDDVYNSSAAAAEPAWSSDSALEDVFADWVPGPPAEAPAAERKFFDDGDAHGIEYLLDTDDDEDDQLQTLLDQAMRYAPLIEVDDDPVAEDAPEAPVSELALLADLIDDDQAVLPPRTFDSVDVTAPEVPVLAPSAIDPDFVPPVPVLPWSRQDDDILPHGRRRRLSLSLSRR
jgi:hypothetical protein